MNAYEKYGLTAPDDVDLMIGARASRTGVVDLSEFERNHLGKITGSNFHRVKYDKGGKWSDLSNTFLAELIFEHDTGQPARRFFGNAATEFGKEWEDIAIDEFEEETGLEGRRQQFFKLEGSRLIGCTPDWYGGFPLEVKVPYNPANHYYTVEKMEVPPIYRPQTQGQILICGSDHAQFLSFNPRSDNPKTRKVLVPVARDGKIAELEARLRHFEETLLNRLLQLEIEPRF